MLYRFNYLILLAVLLSCAPPQNHETATEIAGNTLGHSLAGDEAWKEALLQFRADKDEEFSTSTTSPMAGTLYLKSPPTSKIFLAHSRDDFDLVESISDEASIQLVLRAEARYHFGYLGSEAARVLQLPPVGHQSMRGASCWRSVAPTRAARSASRR